jgi:hypothetical protein
MKPEQKIKTFTRIADLDNAIASDMESKGIAERRYPVRFILFDDFNLFREFATKMEMKGVTLLNLEDLRANANEHDTMISRDELLGKIKAATDSIFVSPVSETIRFYNKGKFNSFLTELTLLEFQNKQMRVYVPLIGLSHRFESFLENFYRIKETAQIWRVISTNVHNIKLFLVPVDFPVPNEIPCLKTFHDWLIFWRNNAPMEKILVSSDCLNTQYKNAIPDNIFEIHNLETGKDFSEKFLERQIPIEYIKADETYWRDMIGHPFFKNNSDFKEFVQKAFNLQKISIQELVEKWLNSNVTSFQRWLLKHYFLNFRFGENPYLSSVLKSIDPDAVPLMLVERVALKIFDKMPLGREYIEQRKQLIDTIGSKWHLSSAAENELCKHISETAQNDAVIAVQLCSGHGQSEHEIIVNLFAQTVLSEEKLQEVYPDLADYLGETVSRNPVISNYFTLYKFAKLTNAYTSEIASIIGILNQSAQTFWNWYHSFPTIENLIAKAKAYVDQTYWLDGVGVEFLPLITAIVEHSHGFQIEQAEIATVKLPSATEFNKPLVPFEKFQDIDAFIHNERYKYPATLCREIEIVRSMMERVCLQTKPMTIALVSDHGLTALSRLRDSKKYTWPEISHEGRYAKIPEANTPANDSDYIVKEVNGEQYRIALGHASLGAKPIREVHGGCTPEEVLVPFVVISNKKKKITPSSNKRNDTSAQKSTHDKSTPTKGFEEDNLF